MPRLPLWHRRLFKQKTMKLKKGDQVIITAGKDKGRKGKVEKVYPVQSRVLILGVNIQKKHAKPRGEKQPGGIIEVAKPLPVSNVAFWCSKCSRPTRIGYKLDKKGEKHRFCRKCQTII